MKDKELKEKLKEEVEITSHYLQFLLDVDYDSILPEINQKIKVKNVIKLAVAEKWIEGMKQKLLKKYGKEYEELFEDLTEILEAEE